MYASSGKIQQLLIFDKMSQNPERAGTSSFDLYWSLIEQYVDFSRELPGLHPVEIHIYFDLNFPPGVPLPQGVEKIKRIESGNGNTLLYFHCTNINNKDDGVGIQWSQDVFIPVNNKCWYYFAYSETDRDGVPAYLLEQLRQTFREVEFKPLPARCEGGNMLLGRYHDFDYLLAGNSNRTPDDTILRDIFQNQALQVIRMPLQTKAVADLLFHLDMYLTIIGQPVVGTFPETQLVFAGKAEGRGVLVKETAAWLDQCCLSLALRQASPYFQVVRIPLLIFNLNEDVAVLSYNNCHVENHKDEKGRRSIHIYFPDYRLAIAKKIGEYCKSNHPKLLAWRHEVRAQMQDFALPTHALSFSKNLMHAMSMFTEIGQGEQDNFAFATAEEINMLVAKTEKEIESICLDLGFDGVHFISANLRDLSIQKKGGLHCMSLVTARTSPD